MQLIAAFRRATQMRTAKPITPEGARGDPLGNVGLYRHTEAERCFNTLSNAQRKPDIADPAVTLLAMPTT